MIRYLALMAIWMVPVCSVFARAGGGGSGGGGGGSSGGGSSYSYSGGGSSGGSATDLLGVLVNILIVGVLCGIVAYIGHLQRKKRIKKAEADIAQAAKSDTVWEQTELRARVEHVFMRFQTDWSNLEPAKMQEYLTPPMYEKIVLELGTLKALHRKNTMATVVLQDIHFMSAVDVAHPNDDRFTAEITASAHDVLLDTQTNIELYSDDSVFTEYWTFRRSDNIWKLENIGQETEDSEFYEEAIKEFAVKHHFYYDPDFGWLMLPYRGVLFHKTHFGTSDVNNHVVGVYRGKIVEFYTYIPNPNQKNPPNYVVAQAILPIHYNDILVRRKRRFFNFAPKGLRKIQTESMEFNRKFVLFAAPGDEARSFELLAPNFMEKIYELPFELNIEVVGNVLYLYSASRVDISYEKLLEILSWAFDEMKM